jgi:hypothetical protein
MAVPLGVDADDASPQLSVIELFTSQGCSSCPTADALLGEYAKRSDIVALSLPVDYWDYLGWKDTLASPKYTLRQRAYARARGDGRIYTPQVVVNGAADVVGSHKGDIDQALDQTTRSLASQWVPVTARSNGAALTVETGPSADQSSKATGTVWLAVIQPSAQVEIQRGENRGRVITYHNVVRNLVQVGNWSGPSTKLEVQESVLPAPVGARCAVLLQQGAAGPIVGAAWLNGK